MAETGYETSTEYVEIDHPWVSHKHVPIYEWTFPEFAKRTDALEWAQLQLDAKIAECRAHSRVRASR